MHCHSQNRLWEQTSVFKAQWASSNNVCQLNKCPVEIVVCFRFGKQNRIHWGSAEKTGYDISTTAVSETISFHKNTLCW